MQCEQYIEFVYELLLSVVVQPIWNMAIVKAAGEFQVRLSLAV